MSVRYKFNHQDFVLREEEVGGLIFDRRTNVFYNLNQAAIDILTWMQCNLTSASILSRLFQFYEVPSQDTLLRDFNEFEALLLEAGVVEQDTDWFNSEEYAPFPQHPYRPIRVEEVDFISRNLPEERAEIIDVGCGSGLYVQYFQRNHEIIGVDLSLDTLCSSEHKGRYIAADVLRLPIKANSFDVVILTGHVLGYLPGTAREDALNEVTRVLRHGGRLIVGVWAGTQVIDVGEDLILVKDPENVERRLHFFSKEEIESMFNEYTIVDSLFLSRNGNFGTEYMLYCCKYDSNKYL
jgi:SAM-dependent methyltransferase